MARLVFVDKAKQDSKRHKIKHHKDWRSVSLALQPTNKMWWEDPDVVVAFNFPRISAALERLMGTNVVRLTDHKYMKELRTRIQADYREHLEKRITARELKEIERERLLIIEGKTDIIPEELSDDPIFLVNKNTNYEIQKQRAKLKTNREKNSERLKLQGVKWERERLQHEEEERIHLAEVYAHRKTLKELEEKYHEEDLGRGMDLLRIDNEDWRPCEQKLKEFLERERAKMKERSLRIPTPYTSDPKDMQNIETARRKFAETQKRMEAELAKKISQQKAEADRQKLIEASRYIVEATTDLYGEEEEASAAHSLHRNVFSLEFEDDALLARRRFSDDATDVSSEIEIFDQGSTISESKRRHAEELAADMEEDVQRGLLISKDQYDHLRFEDTKISQLRQASDMRELYELAEEIIIGERIEDEVIEDVEEEGEEEEVPLEPSEDEEQFV